MTRESAKKASEYKIKRAAWKNIPDGSLYSSRTKCRAATLPNASLLLLDGLGGAGACASAARHALVCVDHVVALTLVDCLNRTLTGARAARDAVITNLVCHSSIFNLLCHRRVLSGRGWFFGFYVGKFTRLFSIFKGLRRGRV